MFAAAEPLLDKKGQVSILLICAFICFFCKVLTDRACIPRISQSCVHKHPHKSFWAGNMHTHNNLHLNWMGDVYLFSGDSKTEAASFTPNSLTSHSQEQLFSYKGYKDGRILDDDAYRVKSQSGNISLPTPTWLDLTTPKPNCTTAPDDPNIAKGRCSFIWGMLPENILLVKQGILTRIF